MILEEKKKELQKLVDQYNQSIKITQELGQKILKIQGGIEVLEEIEKEKENNIKNK